MDHNKEENIIKDILAMEPKVSKSAILKSSGRIIIYGAGETGIRVLALLKRYRIKVDCFLDRKGGDNIFIEGVPVIKPDNPDVDKTASVIVALFNHTIDNTSVLTFLKQAGFTDVILYTELFMHFSNELPVHYWLGPTSRYKSNIREITDMLRMFEDQPSRDLFLSFLKYRVSGDPAYMPPPQIENIYFPGDVPRRTRPIHFIDCGASNGSVCISFRKKFSILDSVRAFEPDPNNYQKLVGLNNKTPLSKDTILFPCGVWSKTAQLKFVLDSPLDSRISEHGSSVIQCVALDDCLGSYKPTLIKMDIEGSELEALKGCKKIITSAKPDLAISIYHTPEHLWEVPLYIRKLAPGYKYYLRSHGYNGFDTVLYAHHENIKNR